MLRIFKTTLTGKTIPKNYSFYNMLGIIPTTDWSNGCGFNLLLDQLCIRFSSAATKKLPGTTEKLNKALPRIHAEKKDELRSSDGTLYDVSDTLENREQKMGKSILKENNLKLFKEIANGDEEVFQLLRQLQIRLDITSCQYGIKVNMKKEDWIEFLGHSSSKRRSYVAYQIINTVRSIKRKLEQPTLLYDLPKEEEEEDANFTDPYDIRCYHLFHNSMFLKLRPGAMKKMYYSKGFTAMLHSSCLVFDCSYNDFMSTVEIKDLARQLNSSVAINFKSEYPYHIMFCNLNKNDRLGMLLQRFNPIIFNDEYPITVTEKSYMELFPKANLVYLTPHCNTNLKCFDPDVTYIIGGFVDKSSKKPISLAKAKQLNLAMAKFPIDQFLDWGIGNKSLSLPHVTKIMLNLKSYGGNWHKAFNVIPQRCLLKTRSKNEYKTSLESEIIQLFQTLDN